MKVLMIMDISIEILFLTIKLPRKVIKDSALVNFDIVVSVRSVVFMDISKGMKKLMFDGSFIETKVVRIEIDELLSS